MFNTFTYEKTMKARRTSESEDKHQLSDRRKYTGVRNQLVNRYNKRIQNFLYRMEENPVEMKEYRNPLDNTPEKYRHRSSKNDFKFVKANWQKLQQSFCKQAQNDRSIASQSIYLSTIRPDLYRERSKSKQVQPQPMRFNYAPKLLRRIHKNNNFTRTDQEDNDSDKIGGRNNESVSYDDDAFSVGSKKSRRNVFPGITTTRTKTTTIQDDDSRKQGLARAENDTHHKLYFKAVVDLCQRQKKLSETAKQILHKCKLVNFKHTSEQSQKDMFESYNKGQ